MLADVAVIVFSCVLSGMFSGLTLWGMARIGMIPMWGFMIIHKNKEENDVQE